MDKESIEVFINSLTHFYRQVGVGEVSVGVPYLLDSKSPLVFDFTGIIGISGKRRGCVYYTCPKAMLTHILTSMGERDVSSAHLCDVVGEIANTIAGNARKAFGADFLISVPVVVQGEPERIHMPDNTRSVVIPTRWKNYQSIIVVALE
ncbi:chemotaxis protein CheX [Candidatus Thalassolituus haligoni]|uniref:chemotaxis protein CheX n=1 Tax=Candidatus Thalassolituus haligoni TaxID=3100113 RepID=UPI003516B29C